MNLAAILTNKMKYSLILFNFGLRNTNVISANEEASICPCYDSNSFRCILRMSSTFLARLMKCIELYCSHPGRPRSRSRARHTCVKVF